MLSAGIGEPRGCHSKDGYRLFNAFKSEFLNTSMPERAKSIAPIVNDDFVKSGCRNGSGWTMQNYTGRHWDMTTFSKWMEFRGEEYTVQVRSIYKPCYHLFCENPQSYDIALYNENGEKITAIEEGCPSFEVDSSENHYLKVIQGLLYSITGEKWVE
jgi:hypothetical protein